MRILLFLLLPLLGFSQDSKERHLVFVPKSALYIYGDMVFIRASDIQGKYPDYKKGTHCMCLRSQVLMVCDSISYMDAKQITKSDTWILNDPYWVTDNFSDFRLKTKL